jgi:hypothetical protein
MSFNDERLIIFININFEVSWPNLKIIHRDIFLIVNMQKRLTRNP